MFGRFWRGERPVAAYCLAYAGVVALAGTGYAIVAADLLGPGASLAVDLLSSALLVLGSIPPVVGLGRRLDARAGPPAAKAGAHALTWLAILVAVLVGSLATRDGYVSLSTDLERLTGGESGQAEARLTLGGGGTDVRLHGTLTEGTSVHLLALLGRNPGVTRIHLTSPGGLVTEGQGIADIVRAKGLVTYVPQACASACTLAFAGGKERLLASGAHLGFHAAYRPGLFGRRFDAGSGVLRDIYVDAGFDAAFVEEALSTPGTTIWTPGEDRLLAARVATRVVDEDDMPSSTLDGGDSDAEALVPTLGRVPLLAAFAERSPEVTVEGMRLYREGYRSGRTEGETMSVLRSYAARMAAGALEAADAATLRASGRLILDAMRSVSVEDPGTCVALGGSADLVSAAEIASAGDADLGSLGSLGLVATPIGSGEIPPLHPRRPGTGVSCPDLLAAYADAVRQEGATDKLAGLLAGENPTSHGMATKFK